MVAMLDDANEFFNAEKKRSVLITASASACPALAKSIRTGEANARMKKINMHHEIGYEALVLTSIPFVWVGGEKTRHTKQL